MLTFKRGLGKNNADYLLKDIYAEYIKQTGSDISYAVFLDICVSFNEFKMSEMVTNGIEFYTESGLGSVSVRKYKCVPKKKADGTLSLANLPVDYKRTKELWSRNEEARKIKKLVRLTNEHTNGFRHRFFWDKSSVVIKNKAYYSFLAMRKFRTLLKSVLTNEDMQVDFYLDNVKITSNSV